MKGSVIRSNNAFVGTSARLFVGWFVRRVLLVATSPRPCLCSSRPFADNGDGRWTATNATRTIPTTVVTCIGIGVFATWRSNPTNEPSRQNKRTKEQTKKQEFTVHHRPTDEKEVKTTTTTTTTLFLPIPKERAFVSFWLFRVFPLSCVFWRFASIPALAPIDTAP